MTSLREYTWNNIITIHLKNNDLESIKDGFESSSMVSSNITKITTIHGTHWHLHREDQLQSRSNSYQIINNTTMCAQEGMKLEGYHI